MIAEKKKKLRQANFSTKQLIERGIGAKNKTFRSRQNGSVAT